MDLLICAKWPAKLENLEKWMRVVSDCAQSQEFPSERVRAIELATEEALVNICSHSNPETIGKIEINCSADDKQLVVDIIDSGIPFDVSTVPDPDLTLSILERRIGGLGVFLLKKMADRVQFQRKGDRNILSLTFMKEIV